MARAALLLLPILLAVGAAAWLFLGEDAVEPGGEDLLAEGESGEGDPPAPRVEEPGTTLAGSPEAGRTKPRRPKWPVLPTDEFPRGILEVTPLAPDDKAYTPKQVTIRLEREETAFWAPPLGVPDYDTGVWRFEKVPIGRVRVVLYGDHVLRTVERTKILKDRTTKVEVFADQGGAIHYTAKLYSGKAPETIKLKLLDAETKKPVSVYWQIRVADAHTGARRAVQVEQGPDGYVFSIPQGRYVLWAQSPEDEIDQPVVEVKRGETTETEILLRK